MKLKMNIGVFGAGNFGATHVKILKQIKHFNIIGFFDPNPERAQEIEKLFNIKAYKNDLELIQKCDAIDIVSATESHFKLLEIAIKHNKHVFIEKPICSNKQELNLLSQIKLNNKTIAQVGHIERYNPAIQKGFSEISDIISIKAKRTGYLNERNQNTPISLDLMIHDIDLVLSAVKSPVQKINAIRKSKRSELHDNIECILVFENGIKAELKAERNNEVNSERNMLIACNDKIVEIDLLNKATKIKTNNNKAPWKKTTESNALKDELMDFYNNINEKKKPLVGIKEACKAVTIALKIEEQINN